jgi:ABC-type uncharacterized transport system involved in gliding motility auxiliary subunit
VTSKDDKTPAMNVRRWLARLNVVATLLLLGALFILVSFLASRRYVRGDFTRAKISTLSDKTRQVLTYLTEPVSVVVFYQPTTPEGQPVPLYPLMMDLLKEYARFTPKLTTEYVEPYRDRARAEQLAKQFDIDRINLVIVQSGTRHKYLSDADLIEYDYASMAFGGQPVVKSFKGEDAVTSAIVSVTQAAQPLVWVTTGHQEKALEDLQPLGLAELKKYLERENMRAEAVSLLEHADIPPDVAAVMIPGPTQRFVDQELLLLQAYLERGGRLLVLLDPMANSGLDGLLSRWGIELGQDMVVDPAIRIPFVSAANLLVTTYIQHPIVERMDTEKLITLFPLVRSVRSAKEPEGIKLTPLAMTSPAGWGETQMDAPKAEFNEGVDTKGPISIAMAAERQASPATRVVVVGDSDFVTNAQLLNAPGNLDFVLGAMHWLAAQEQLIGIGPKPLESLKLNLTAAQMRGIFWLSLAALPSLMILLGVGTWWLRRR